MKRILSVLLVLTMIFGTGITAFGAKQENSTIEVVDGISNKSQQVKLVNLLMGGRDAFTDVPSLLYSIDNNSRTLVPIRFVAEYLGAEIEWNQEQKKATITTEDKTIVLGINSATAYVNGKKFTLPDGVPAKLLGYQGNYRTMVPLRFVSEQLGMDVGWKQETTTATVDYRKQSITGIEYDESSAIAKILIKTTGNVSFMPMYLQGSKYGSNDRLVIDIPNAKLQMNDPTIKEQDGLIVKNIGKNGITTVRGSLFEATPRDVTRIVVDLSKQKGYNVFFDEEQNVLKVEFLNNVTDVHMDKINNVDAVVIDTEETPSYNIMDLGNRVVVDVLNAQLKFDKSEIAVSRGGINRIRIATFEPDVNYDKDDKIVRVVLDLEQGQSAENIFVEHQQNQIFVYLNDNPLKGLNYEKVAYNASQLSLALEEEDKYDLGYSSSSRELELKVPKSSMELEGTQLDVDDDFVEYITIDGEQSSKYYYVTVKLTEGTKYENVTGNSISDNILIKFMNEDIEVSRYSGKMIIVDAGHGGKDPGAVSAAYNIKEKELALDTALRLNELLKEAGFDTYLTREDDTYIGLYERTEMANGLNADAFVSVHYNAHSDKNISGVQVLYNGDDPNRDNKTFASIVQEEMLKELGAVDRKIIERPNLVVIRETKMPAVLTEMAFLSNDWEASKSSTEEYRQKCAQALFNGITRYFDEVLLK